MRKLYIFLLLIGITAYVNGQRNLVLPKAIEVDSPLSIAQEKSHSAEPQKSLQAVGDIIWSENFSAGVVPAGWELVDNTGNGFNWIVSDQPPGGQYSTNQTVINSTSGGHFMVLRGDFYNTPMPNPPVQMDAYFQTDSIDCSAFPYVTLKFQQKLRWCCSNNDPFKVMVSTDKINWTTYLVKGTNVVNAVSLDPEQVEINISSVAGGSPTVYLRFYESEASHYYWMIDDIVLVESPMYDLQMKQPLVNYIDTNLGYYSITPFDQAWWYFLMGDIENMGSLDDNDLNLHVTVNDGIQTVFDSFNDSIGTFESTKHDTLIADSVFYPDHRAIYTAQFEVSSPNPDEFPDNNFGEVEFIVGDTVFAHDHGNPTNWISPASYVGGGDGDLVGVDFYLPGDDSLSSVSTYITSNSTVGSTLIRAEVWKYDSGLSDWVLQIDSEEHFIEPQDKGNWVTLRLTDDDGFQKYVTGNNYYAAMISFTYGTDTLRIGNDMSNAGLHDFQSETRLRIGGGDWSYATSTPMVRLNLFRDVINDTLVAGILESSDVSCFEANDGWAKAGALGGDMNYSFAWSNGQTDATAIGLPAGTYTVTVTDGTTPIPNTATASVTILDDNTQIVATPTITHTTCVGGDGSILLSVTGGVSPYTYSWNNGDTGILLDSLSGGSYTCIITDSNGCVSNNQFDIMLSDGPSVSYLVTQPSYFGGSDGAIDVTVSGGTPPYSYLWSNDSASTTQDITGLIKGSYTVTITDSGACNLTQVIAVNQPALNCPAAFIIEVEAITNLSCYQSGDGVIKLTIDSVKYPPLTFDWSQYDYSSPTASDLYAGTHSVVVTDSMGCSHFLEMEVLQPDQIVINLVSATLEDFGESNGSLDISVIAGVQPLAYDWSNDATDQDLTGVTAGTYTVTVMDSTGCTKTGTFFVLGGDAPCDSLGVTGSVSGTDALCYGSATGTAIASGSSTWPPIEYLWSNGQTTSTAVNLAPGIYSVQMTDSATCQFVTEVTIAAPAGMVITTDSVNSAGFGASDGAIYLSTTGGTQPLSYSWSDSSNNEDLVGVSGGWYYLTVSDSLSCTGTTSVYVIQDAPDCSGLGISGSITPIGVSCNGDNNGMAIITATTGYPPFFQEWSNGQDTDTITGLSAGPISILLVDSAGCFINLQTTITEPDAISISGTATNETADTANDGSIDITVVGGTGSMTYLWSNDSITEDLAMLDSNWYVVVVTDSLECMDSASFFVSTLDTTCLLSVTMDSLVDVSCFGGSDGLITVSPVSGTAPYSYLWGNGQTTATISGLSAGNYTVVLSDLSCSTQLTIPVLQPAKLVISGIISNASWSNADGSVNITVTGGNSGNTYAWSNFTYNEDLSGVLGDSYYYVTATDSLSCSAITIFYVGENAANCADSGITATIAPSNVSCNGSANGGAVITSSSSYLPISYDWSNGATSSTVSGLVIGNYSALVTDLAGCVVTVSASITEPSAILISTISITAASFGDANGAIDINVSGGTEMSGSPYSYEWSNFATTQDISPINGNLSYSVTVSDSLGCTKSATYFVPEVSDCGLNGVVGNVTTNDAVCFGTSTGSALVSASGNYPPFTYAWSNGSTNAAANNLGAGNYVVVVSDSAGCNDMLFATIGQPSSIVITSEGTINTSFGQVDGIINVGISGGTPSYSYLWSNNTSLEDATGLSTGLYVLTVTDSLGCTKTFSALISQSNPICDISGTMDITPVTCFGTTDGGLLINATSSYPPVTFQWDDATTDSLIENFGSGAHYVVLTDSANCVDTVFASILGPDAAVSIAQDSIATPLCNGDLSGYAAVVASGGYGVYGYAWSNSGTSAAISGVAASTYTVTITDNGICPVSINVTITEPAVLVASVDADSTDRAINLTVTGGTSPFSYSWDNNETTEDLDSLDTGTYSVIVTDNNGCTATASQSAVGGISQINFANLINIYPNPTRGTLHITNVVNSTIRLYDVLGNVVLRSDNTQNVMQLDISNLSNGTYYLKISNDKFSVAKKVYLIRE